MSQNCTLTAQNDTLTGLMGSNKGFLLFWGKHPNPGPHDASFGHLTAFPAL